MWQYENELDAIQDRWQLRRDPRPFFTVAAPTTEGTMLLHHAFEYHALSRGEACFATWSDGALTYREAHDRSLEFAGRLGENGITQGDRVAILMRNSPDYLILILAASRIGAVVVPLNIRLARAEWAGLLNDAGARLLVADPDYATAWAQEVRASEPFLSSLTGSQEPVWLRLERARREPGTAPGQASSSPDDIVIQMYTSGTTGKAKGALISHAAFVHNVSQGLTAFPYRLNPGELMLAVLPMFHIAALTTLFGAIAGGGGLLIQRDVDPVAIVNALAQENVVTTCLVPAIIQLIISAVPDLEERGFPSLRYIAYGASPISEPLLRAALNGFGCPLAQGYGMTETAGLITILGEVDHQRALHGRPELLLSAGLPVPGTEIRICDADGHDLLPGQVGEVWVRGKQLMSGYWQMPEATAETLVDGWLRTGDAGELNAEGYLFLRDRMKDMISSGAENIYPAEIEQVLVDHPDIAEVAVIGVPDPFWGEAVMAVLVSAGSKRPTEEDLAAFCRDRLGKYKIPRHFSFVSALPRNATGKVLKRELRAPHWKDRERAIG